MLIAYTLYRFNSESCKLAASCQLDRNYVVYQSSILFRIVGEKIECSKVIGAGCERKAERIFTFHA